MIESLDKSDTVKREEARLAFKTLAYDVTQTCHSIEMKNLDLTNKKSGSGGKKQDHGPIGYKKK